MTQRGDVLPGQAHANAKVYCAGSSCYAAAFEFKNSNDPTYGGPVTLFTAYLQNLQGTYPSGGPDTPLQMDGFYLQFIDTNEDPWSFLDARNEGLSFSALGNVQAGLFNFLGHDGPANPEENPNYDIWVADLGSTIVGCNVWPGNPPGWFAFRSCPKDGLDGWVKIVFTLRRVRDGAGVRPPVRFDDFFFSFGALYSAGGYCTIGGNQPGTCTELPYRTALGKHASP